MTEEISWKEQPSQLLNLGVFLSIIFVVTIPFILLRWKSLKETFYEITKTSACLRVDFIEKRKDCIDLNDIKDISLYQPLFLRLLGLSDLIITSFDDRQIVYAGLKDPDKVLRVLKKN